MSYALATHILYEYFISSEVGVISDFVNLKILLKNKLLSPSNALYVQATWSGDDGEW
jgi:hypothetical protein